jgi:putative restriction endonuclease
MQGGGKFWDSSLNIFTFAHKSTKTSMRGKYWDDEELKLVLNLYIKLPFGKIHTSTPEVLEMAKLLGRTASSVAIRLANFASCDPNQQARGIQGMPAGKGRCLPIWELYHSDPESFIYETELQLATRRRQLSEVSHAGESPTRQDFTDMVGDDRTGLVKQRVNQAVFRLMVLANYGNRCAISGLNIPQLLVASHIIPWAANKQERLNPANGICLSPLYDRAFDLGLLAITPDFRVRLSPSLAQYQSSPAFQTLLGISSERPIMLPSMFPPNRDFLQWHYDHIFLKG